MASTFIKNNWKIISAALIVSLATLLISNYSSLLKGAFLVSTNTNHPVQLEYEHIVDLSSGSVNMPFNVNGLSSTNKIASVVLFFDNFPTWLQDYTVDNANNSVIPGWTLDTQVTDFSSSTAKLRFVGEGSQPYLDADGHMFDLNFNVAAGATPTAVGIRAEFVMANTFQVISTDLGSISFVDNADPFRIYPEQITPINSKQIKVRFDLQNTPAAAQVSSTTVNITSLPQLSGSPLSSLVVLNGFAEDGDVTSFDSATNTLRIKTQGTGTTPYMIADGALFEMTFSFVNDLTAADLMVFNSEIVNNLTPVTVASMSVPLYVPSTCTTSTNIADIDEDGLVDIDDVTYIMNNWRLSGSAIVPARTDIINDSMIQIKDFGYDLSEWGWQAVVCN